MARLTTRQLVQIAICSLYLYDMSNAQATDDRALKPSSKAKSEHRVALVIGNSTYANAPLKNPVNDAKDMSAALRGLGFEVIERTNLQSKQIGSTLREFRTKLRPGAVALVFYAGHGLQIKGDNYLPTIDADINSEEDVPNQSLAVKQITDVLEESKSRLNLVFLDACRNNPYASRSFRSTDRGLARVITPSGTLISYATKPGSVAADGNGRNGLYTSKLLAQMNSSLQIELALKRVVSEVKTASQGKQEPWMEGSIEGDFCFAGCGAQSAPTITPTVTQAKNNDEIEDDTWKATETANSIEAYGAYLEGYKNGRYAVQAKLNIAALKKSIGTSETATTKAKLSHPIQETSVIPIRPVTRHFDTDENLWSTLENSQAYRNLPKARSIKIDFKVKHSTDEGDEKPLITNEVVAVSVTPLGEKCFKQKTNKIESKETSVDYQYACGKFWIGSVDEDNSPYKRSGNLLIEGSLFPLRVGTEQSWTSHPTDYNSGEEIETRSMRCKVKARIDAGTLSPKLSGVAWVIPCEFNQSRGSFFNKTKYTNVHEDYFLENLGLFLSQIGQFDSENKRYVLPTAGSQISQENNGIWTTSTYKSYDWKVSDSAIKNSPDEARPNVLSKNPKTLPTKDYSSEDVHHGDFGSNCFRCHRNSDNWKIIKVGAK